MVILCVETFGDVMSLKPRRIMTRVHNAYFCNSVIERGSPVGTTNITNFPIIVAPSNQVKNVVGILMEDVVDIDSKTSINWMQDEVIKGSKVHVCTDGLFLTNCIDSSFKNQTKECDLFVDYRTNKFTTRSHKHTSEKVGRFHRLDSDGFAEITIRI